MGEDEPEPDTAPAAPTKGREMWYIYTDSLKKQ